MNHGNDFQNSYGHLSDEKNNDEKVIHSGKLCEKNESGLKKGRKTRHTRFEVVNKREKRRR